MRDRLAFIQIITQAYEYAGKRGELLIGLTADGAVYKYQFKQNGWLAIPMKEVEYTPKPKQPETDDDTPF